MAAMKVLLASHPSAMTHDTGVNHPERPQRVSAVIEGAHRSGLEIVPMESPAIDRSLLETVHDPAYVEMIELMSLHGGGALDFDTRLSEGTWVAALHAAGGVQALVEELEDSHDTSGLAVTRPPGHHALADRGMGFCFFNNVAITAAWLRRRGRTVAVIDWDVHHGNGTQALLEDDPGSLYVSLHQEPFYPYEGRVDDIDRAASGTTVNIPLPAGTAGDVYREAWGTLVLPIVGQFEPDWVLLSAGYDAHVDDPLADLALTAPDYGWMAARLTEIHPVSRLVLALEGGYDLAALESSVSATLEGLAGVETDAPPLLSGHGSRAALANAASVISRHWQV
jgi:acetoin utilization deacetylase AcuC-like enzyme